ncbi:hypothetical protein GQ600_20923 [Phytophthora cactorum]|nr:hypothetical protein GQ600_20923 [Phytophthora cactorum]
MLPLELWSALGMNRQRVNRTNNTLERYTRELNNDFATRRSNWSTVIGLIEQHAHHHRYVALVENIPLGHARPPPDGKCCPPEFTM